MCVIIIIAIIVILLLIIITMNVSKDCDKEGKTLVLFCFPWILFSREWIHVGHWSCSLLARLSTWIYVIWTCPRQPLKDISLSESEERLGCSPKWASSVGGRGRRVLHPLDWAPTLGFKFQSYALLLTHADLLQSLSSCRCGHVRRVSACGARW